jgi:Uma2 family endonuclease
MFALSGASVPHEVITGNILAGLHARLRDKPCRVFPPGLKILVAPTGLFAYPDVVVVCGRPEYVDGVRDVVKNPVLVVEVLSPSTEAWDRGGKFAHYRQLPTLREILFVAQDEVRVEQYTRQEGAAWLLTEAAALDAVVHVSSLDCELPVAEIYAKVDGLE